MATPLKYSVGFDCSKDEFSACITLMDTDQNTIVKTTRKFRNAKKEFESIEKWIRKHHKHEVPLVNVMEATGNYYENLALFLNQKDYYVCVVLPNKAKKYMESRGIKTKNDPIDAKGLAQMGAEQRMKKWEPLSPQIYQLRLLTRHCEKMSKQRTQLINQLKSLEYGMYQNQKVEGHLQQMIDLIEDQIKEAKNQIENLTKEDTNIKERFDKILEIKGLGQLTLATIIAETNGFALFENQKQLTSYAGYDVVENSSGQRIGKTRISKKGNSHIRRALHMPSLNVVKYGETEFVKMYENIMQKTGIKMKAYAAIQRKLLILIYTLWKKNEEYNRNYEGTSGNEEPKLLFSLDFEEVKKVPDKAGTLDELPCKESPEVLFSLKQNYG